MWAPWAVLARWGRRTHETSVENARVAAVACSRARLERVEIELYVAEVAERRARPPITA